MPSRSTTTTGPWPAWSGWPTATRPPSTEACDVSLSYTDIDLGVRGRAIGLLARVLYPDLPNSLIDS
jgi:hypothetical protein